MDEHDLVDGFCEWMKQDEARDIDSPEFRNELARLFECVRAETRAAILADEERRVWMEEYMHAIDGTNSAATARASAESMLEAWREARAAWEERDG